MIIDLTCRFCGQKCGEIDAPKGSTPQDLGYIDTRCDADQTLHGSFKEMFDEYYQTCESDPLKAEAFVIANPKRADFDAQVSAIIAEKTKLDATIDPEKPN